MILSPGTYGRQPIDASLLNQCLSLSLPLSKNNAKMSSGKDLKNKKYIKLKLKKDSGIGVPRWKYRFGSYYMEAVVKDVRE